MTARDRISEALGAHFEDMDGGGFDVAVDAILDALLNPGMPILAAAAPALKSVDNCVAIAAIHGAALKWADSHPPVWHAWNDMIRAIKEGK